MMAKAHRAENFLLGEGLGRILLNAMLPMAVCTIFLSRPSASSFEHDATTVVINPSSTKCNNLFILCNILS